MTSGKRHKALIYRGRIDRTGAKVSRSICASVASSPSHTLVNFDVCALTAAKGVVSGSVLSILEVLVATSAWDRETNQDSGTVVAGRGLCHEKVQRRY